MKSRSSRRNFRVYSIIGIILVVLLIINLAPQNIASASPPRFTPVPQNVSLDNTADLSINLPPVIGELNQLSKKGNLPAIPLLIVTDSPPIKITDSSVLLSATWSALVKQSRSRSASNMGKKSAMAILLNFRKCLPPEKPVSG